MVKCINRIFLEEFCENSMVIINYSKSESKLNSMIKIMCDEFESLVSEGGTFCFNFINAFGENNSDNSRKIHLSNLLFLERRIINLREEFLNIKALNIIKNKDHLKKLNKLLDDLETLDKATEDKAKEVEIIVEIERNNVVIGNMIDHNYEKFLEKISELELKNRKLMAKQKEYFYIVLILMFFIGVLAIIGFFVK